jgi:hypothetical protein
MAYWLMMPIFIVWRKHRIEKEFRLPKLPHFAYNSEETAPLDIFAVRHKCGRGGYSCLKSRTSVETHSHISYRSQSGCIQDMMANRKH